MFNFIPKFIVLSKRNTGWTNESTYFLWGASEATSYDGNLIYTIGINTSWFSYRHPSAQMNNNDETYFYFAIGN